MNKKPKPFSKEEILLIAEKLNIDSGTVSAFFGYEEVIKEEAPEQTKVGLKEESPLVEKGQSVYPVSEDHSEAYRPPFF